MSKIFTDSEGNKYEQCSPMDAPSYYVIKPIKAEDKRHYTLELTAHAGSDGKDSPRLQPYGDTLKLTEPQAQAVAEAVMALKDKARKALGGDV